MTTKQSCSNEFMSDVVQWSERTDLTPEVIEFWQRCFEAVVDLGEAEDIWSEYVAGPSRTNATVADAAILSGTWSAPDFSIARASTRSSGQATERKHATSRQGAADGDYS